MNRSPIRYGFHASAKVAWDQWGKKWGKKAKNKNRKI